MFGKLFQTCYSGSMVGAGAAVFAVWPYAISNAVKGRVELNPVLMAAILGMPVQAVEQAIDYLCQPDPRSRSKEHDGRRLIREGEFQYFMPTHGKYSAMRTNDDRREYFRLKKREQRAKVKLSNGLSLTCPHMSTESTHTDTETDTDTELLNVVGAVAPTSSGKKQPIDFLAGLKADPAYSGIDVEREAAKMHNWCKANGKQPTPRRFINWLNRIEKPMPAPAPATAPKNPGTVSKSRILEPNEL
jgi:hypothetical protein